MHNVELSSLFSTWWLTGNFHDTVVENIYVIRESPPVLYYTILNFDFNATFTLYPFSTVALQINISAWNIVLFTQASSSMRL